MTLRPVRAAARDEDRQSGVTSAFPLSRSAAASRGALEIEPPVCRHLETCGHLDTGGSVCVKEQSHLADERFYDPGSPEADLRFGHQAIAALDDVRAIAFAQEGASQIDALRRPRRSSSGVTHGLGHSWLLLWVRDRPERQCWLECSKRPWSSRAGTGQSPARFTRTCARR